MSRRQRTMIDALEPRRLLTAQFQGTNDADTITIYTQGSEMHVVINGIEHITPDESVILLCRDGDDFVYLGAMSGNRQMAIHLGSDNDTVTNYDPQSNLGVLGNIGIRELTVRGDSGHDQLLLDDSDGTSINTYAFERRDLPNNLVSYELVTDTTRINHATNQVSGIEEITLDQNHTGTRTVLEAKPASSHLRVTGGSGNDEFEVGGGDYDKNGWAFGTATVFGGAGDDFIEFDDSIDDTPDQPLTVAGFTLTRGSMGFTYSAIESQLIYTAHGSGNVADIDGVSGFIESTTIRASNSIVNLNVVTGPTTVTGVAGTVNVGRGDLGLLQGPITIDQTAFGGGDVYIHDEVVTVGRIFQLSADQLSGPVEINYRGSDTFNVYAGHGNDTFNVDAVPTGTDVLFHGGNGNDAISLGGGVPDSVRAPVHVSGGAGTDVIFLRNGHGGGFTSAVLTGSSFTANNGPVHLYDTAEQLHLSVYDAGSDVDVLGVTTPTTIHGAAGDDRVDVGGGNLSTNPAASLHVRGGAGLDAIELNDADSTDPLGSYAFDVEGGRERFLRSNIKGSATLVSAEEVERRTLHANDTPTTIRVYDALTALRVNANGGIDGVFVNDAATPVTLSSGAGTDYLQVGRPFDAASPTVLFEQDDELGGMSIYKGTVRVRSGAVLCNLGVVRNSIGEPVIAGTLDLAGGAYLGRPGQYALSADAIRALLVRGRNGGAWNGTNSPNGSIHSSLAASSPLRDAVGYGTGAQVAPASVGSFSINPDDVLVRHTFDGDANLDERVTLADFNRLAGSFGTSSPWAHGDFDYSGNVNLADFNALAATFGSVAGADEGQEEDR